jgi:hypothetical protein
MYVWRLNRISKTCHTCRPVKVRKNPILQGLFTILHNPHLKKTKNGHLSKRHLWIQLYLSWDKSFLTLRNLTCDPKFTVSALIAPPCFFGSWRPRHANKHPASSMRFFIIPSGAGLFIILGITAAPCQDLLVVACANTHCPVVGELDGAFCQI